MLKGRPFKRVLDHYENQTEDEAVAEDEAAWEDASQTFIEVPNELVPTVRKLLAKKGSLILIDTDNYKNESRT